MSQEEENYVALFIDWDNIAISTSVDFGGAVPDVRAIVHASQRFGTVVLARAYAEWNVSSDRLSVYRAGVEPVYAPTFRFEPEPGSQMPRGKSLADPCLVTDAIDLLHLMPQLSVFVLVSGDKDLIPIVRLAQLRGKKAVVIGPDFVAQILREMADEYIPYRGLVEAAEATPVAEVAAATRTGRRLHGSSRSTHQLTAAPSPARTNNQTVPQSPAAPATAPPTRAASVTAPTRPPTIEPPAETSPTPPAAALDVAAPPSAPPAEPPTEAVGPEEATESPATLFELIRGILREREDAGKPRLRATNLKDQLLARISGFNERRYGFSRFKDLLATAEKAGVLNVTRTGPVQWVTLATESPTANAPAPAATTPLAPISPAPPAASTTSESTGPRAELDAVATNEPVDLDVVRFVLDLRDRSRWLTYTYLLTNLLNHLGKGSADAAADTAARTALNQLVQSGVLVVDREPREIDVNGTRHRVRLCHVVDEHPIVERLKEQAAEAEPLALPEPTVSASSLAETVESPPIEAQAPRPDEGTAPETATAGPVELTERAAMPVIEAGAPVDIPAAAIAGEPAASESGEQPGREDVGEPIERRPTGEAPPTAPFEAPPSRSAIIEAPTAVSVGQAPEGGTAMTTDETEPETAVTGESATGESSNVGSARAPEALPSEGASTAVEAQPTEVRSLVEAEPPRSTAIAENGAVPNQPLTLADSYGVLREVVREATGPNRPNTGPAAVKNRLVRRLGTFDERAFGFSKFKDYLLAAEKAGAIKVEIVGTAARVSLPPEP